MQKVSLAFDSERENLIKNGKVEVVVVISNSDVATGSHSNTNGEVWHALSADLTQVVALVVEHLDTVGPVVADEHLLVVIHCNTIGELKMPGKGIVIKMKNQQSFTNNLSSPGARKLGQHIANHIEDDDPHHFALDHHNPAPGVNSDAARVLQHIRPKLPHELPILAEYLYLN